MKLPQKIVRALWLLSCGLVLSNSAPGVEPTRLSGKLIYFGNDSVVTELNLVTLERRAIYERPGLHQQQITHVSGDTFIVKTADDELYLVTPGKDVKHLGAGSNPAYFPKHRKLLFISNRAQKKGPQLYEARLENDELHDIKEIQAGPFSSPTPIVAISEDEAILHQSTGTPILAGVRSYLYHLGNSTQEPLPIKNCRPVGWRAATQQLICEEGESVALVSLDGKNIVKLPKLEGIAVGPYLATQDILLGSRARLSLRCRCEASDLVAYDFKSNSIEVIAESVRAYPGAAYWTE